MVDKIPSKSEIFDITQAQSESLEDFSKRFVKIETQIENQEDRNRNIIIIVLFTFIAIVVSVAVEVILTSSANQGLVGNLQDKVQSSVLKNEESIQGVKLENTRLQAEIDTLRRSNPYLK